MNNYWFRKIIAAIFSMAGIKFLLTFILKWVVWRDIGCDTELWLMFCAAVFTFHPHTPMLYAVFLYVPAPLQLVAQEQVVTLTSPY